MYYRHNLNYKYPERSDEHMITVKHVRDTNFDENYQYREKGAWHTFKRGVLQVLLNTIVYPLCRIKHGFKIYGKKNLKKHKKELKNGAITIANHVFMWDYICVMRVLRPHIPYFPAWKTNFEGPCGPLVRWVGGMPVPTDNVKAMVKFSREIKETLDDGKWVHFFPEGSMWWYYPDIRPFKNTVFKLSVKSDKPIIPISFSFRPRKGIQKWFGKTPLVDIHIGEPLRHDKSLPQREAISKLHAEAYHTMQVLAGITPESPTYNTNQNIDEYRKTM